ncbi:MAG: DUF402 domain-containing protein [Halodesulfurarchaeum sp.]
MTRVRLRGIYATALTRRLHEAGFDVVHPSSVIDDRFESSFGTDEVDIDVDATRDRQGIEIVGTPSGVETVTAELEGTAVDTFDWEAIAPLGAIFDAEVLRTSRGGAIVSLGPDREGFLPFGSTEEYVDDGDEIQVQVHEPKPPWSSDRPRVSPDVEAPGVLATLVRGADARVVGTPDGRPEHELVRTTELLSTDVPENWGVRWEYPAEDADVKTLDAALSRLVERAESIESALEADTGTEAPIAKPVSGVWIWFGRESRFALDDDRASVTATMTGHHRIKAGSDGAGSAVDFAEHLEVDADEFPFDAVTDVFGPTVGDEVTIRHGKPDGRCLTLGQGSVTDRSVEKSRITVEREMSTSGSYDGLGTERKPGDVATTRFAEGRWWYPTVYRTEDGQVKGTYVNVATPVEIFPSTIRYVDLHVDVVKRPDGTVEIVDEDELTEAVSAGHLTESIAEKASAVSTQVANALQN